MLLNVHRNSDGEKGGRGMAVEEEGDYIGMEGGKKREIIQAYLSLHCHHQNDSCIKMGSDESHFNVSLTSK